MLEFLSRHRAGTLMLSCCAFSFLCLSLRLSPYVVGLKTSVWFLFSPEIVYSGEFFNKLDSLRGRIFQLVHAEGENHMLRQQNAILSKKELERDALEEENNRLRSMLSLKQKLFPEAIAAEVVGRDIRDWFHSVTINKGSDDGVELSAAVVADGNGGRPTLVGRIIEVRNDTSKVMLLTDAVSAISVTLARGGDIGLLEGRNKPWVLLNYLPQKADVVAGDQVVTVGLGGIFPPGIPVGKILSVEATPGGFFKEAKVQPDADLGSVRDVLILLRKDLAKYALPIETPKVPEAPAPVEPQLLAPGGPSIASPNIPSKPKPSGPGAPR
jgi:rod shape-determining protein MreC